MGVTAIEECSKGVGEQVSTLIDTLSIVLQPHSAIFVSGPVSSGRRMYLEKNRSVPPQDLENQNVEELESFARVLRNRITNPVICAAKLRINKWPGKNYTLLFRRVLEKFVIETWFKDDWEFSTGSVNEMKICLDLHIPCRSENGESLTSMKAKQLCLAAKATLDTDGIIHNKLQKAHNRLIMSVEDF